MNDEIIEVRLNDCNITDFNGVLVVAEAVCSLYDYTVRYNEKVNLYVITKKYAD